MDDLSSYTEEMQSPQLEKACSCITLTSKMLNKLKLGAFPPPPPQPVSDKGIFLVFSNLTWIYYFCWVGSWILGIS